MLAIVDYGVGNLFSLCSSLKSLNQPAVITSDPKEISAADRVILPGVGAFGDAAEKLRNTGLEAVVREQAKAGSRCLAYASECSCCLKKVMNSGSMRAWDCFGATLYR